VGWGRNVEFERKWDGESGVDVRDISQRLGKNVRTLGGQSSKLKTAAPNRSFNRIFQWAQKMPLRPTSGGTYDVRTG
jgi:hypothetical protein